MTLQYFLLEMPLDLEHRSNSPAIFFGMLIPMVLVPFPMGFVVIVFPFYSNVRVETMRPLGSTLVAVTKIIRLRLIARSPSERNRRPTSGMLPGNGTLSSKLSVFR